MAWPSPKKDISFHLRGASDERGMVWGGQWGLQSLNEELQRVDDTDKAFNELWF